MRRYRRFPSAARQGVGPGARQSRRGPERVARAREGAGPGRREDTSGAREGPGREGGEGRGAAGREAARPGPDGEGAERGAGMERGRREAPGWREEPGQRDGGAERVRPGPAMTACETGREPGPEAWVSRRCVGDVPPLVEWGVQGGHPPGQIQRRRPWRGRRRALGIAGRGTKRARLLRRPGRWAARADAARGRPRLYLGPTSLSRLVARGFPAAVPGRFRP
jgi:hypothetical protein